MLKIALSAMGFLALAAVHVSAAEWPTRPVTMVVPFSAGGPLDGVARILASQLSTELGQPIADLVKWRTPLQAAGLCRNDYAADFNSIRGAAGSRDP